MYISIHYSLNHHIQIHKLLKHTEAVAEAIQMCTKVYVYENDKQHHWDVSNSFASFLYATDQN